MNVCSLFAAAVLFLEAWSLPGVSSDPDPGRNVTTTSAFTILQVADVAGGSTAIQSSTYRDDDERFGAQLAVDGSELTCSKTQWSWTLFWRADLQEERSIIGANFTLKWEYFGIRAPPTATTPNKFIYNLDLFVQTNASPDLLLCDKQSVTLDRPADYSVSFVCAEAISGRFVTINVNPSYAGAVTTGSPQLTLCHVRIFTPLQPALDEMSANSTDLPANVSAKVASDKVADKLNISLVEVQPASAIPDRRKMILKESARLKKLITQMQHETTALIKSVEPGLSHGLQDNRHDMSSDTAAGPDLTELQDESLNVETARHQIVTLHNYVVISVTVTGVLFAIILVGGFCYCFRRSKRSVAIAATHSVPISVPSSLFRCSSPAPVGGKLNRNAQLYLREQTQVSNNPMAQEDCSAVSTFAEFNI